MKKKVISFFLAMALGAVSLTGCSSSGSSSTGSQKTENKGTGDTTGQVASTTKEAVASSKGEKKAVTLWYYWETVKHQEILGQEINKFNESQDQLTVEAKYVPFADFKKQLSIGASAAELPDIVIIDGPDHASYASMGIFADLTGKVDVSQYYDGPIASCTLEGKLFGVPFGSNCLSLYYNEDMLKEAGQKVPETWDELKTTAKALTKENVSGFAFSGVQNEEGTFNFMPWLWSTGDDSLAINNENGIKALSFVGDLVKEGCMSKEVINWTQGDVMNQFISGNVAMMINGPWQVPTIRQQAPNLKWNVALIPKDNQFASVLGGENFAIIENKNIDASLEFVKFVTSKDEVKSYIDGFGYIAARRDVADAQFSDDLVMKKFAEQMKYAKPRGPHPSWPEISDAISLAFNQVITETSTPQQAAEEAQSKIDGIIKK
ncbi:ABC transporter substrate-binding protein [Lacrimispora algidixylanolytica]|uniref:Sugar ABC transporter substrate-binding protein n=1 Tax=Lacrimispora algidixylanolytica TaxID=94868 RepID=A0A419SYG7_9FIRM|nr:ABC transporter substrate-binding protein [Lacrimispora algidixylanolytica]RKD30209.1 sugar ABC transporter substrate-binding protein [Lacrimispora algidixylanolytica]